MLGRRPFMFMFATTLHHRCNCGGNCGDETGEKRFTSSSQQLAARQVVEAGLQACRLHGQGAPVRPGSEAQVHRCRINHTNLTRCTPTLTLTLTRCTPTLTLPLPLIRCTPTITRRSSNARSPASRTTTTKPSGGGPPPPVEPKPSITKSRLAVEPAPLIPNPQLNEETTAVARRRS